MWQSVALVSAGVIALLGVFRAIESNWPFSYYTLGDLDRFYRISQSPIRYLLFRFGPVYLVALSCAVTASRLQDVDLSSYRTALGVALGYGVVALLLPALCAAKGAGGSIRSLPLAVAYVGIFLGCLAVGWLSGVTASQLAVVVPRPADLVTALWTAAFAGVAVALVTRATASRAADAHRGVEVSMSQIDGSWIDRAVAASTRSGADAALVLAVMIVENLQRPGWFRTLEQIKGRVLKKGTYGVMQVWAAEPISDEMSIDQAAEILSAYSDLRDERGYPRHDTFRALGISYNGSRSYGDLVCTAYQRVRTAAWVEVHSAPAAEPGSSTPSDVQATSEIDDLYRSFGKMAATLILRYRDSVLADDELSEES